MFQYPIEFVPLLVWANIVFTLHENGWNCTSSSFYLYQYIDENTYETSCFSRFSRFVRFSFHIYFFFRSIDSTANMLSTVYEMLFHLQHFFCLRRLRYCDLWMWKNGWFFVFSFAHELYSSNAREIVSPVDEFVYAWVSKRSINYALDFPWKRLKSPIEMRQYIHIRCSVAVSEAWKAAYQKTEIEKYFFFLFAFAILPGLINEINGLWPVQITWFSTNCYDSRINGHKRKQPMLRAEFKEKKKNKNTPQENCRLIQIFSFSFFSVTSPPTSFKQNHFICSCRFGCSFFIQMRIKIERTKSRAQKKDVVETCLGLRHLMNE